MDAMSNPDEVIEMDGVGGVSILAPGANDRCGVHFPRLRSGITQARRHSLDGKAMGFRVAGLPIIRYGIFMNEDDLRRCKLKKRKRRRGSETLETRIVNKR